MNFGHFERVLCADWPTSSSSTNRSAERVTFNRSCDKKLTLEPLVRDICPNFTKYLLNHVDREHYITSEKFLIGSSNKDSEFVRNMVESGQLGI